MKMKPVHCSFCGRSERDAVTLIFAPEGGGDGVICNCCVKVCASIVSGKTEEKVQVMPRSRLAAWFLRMFTSYYPS
jgi:ATP-dependent protease Clp ATPase subunit